MCSHASASHCHLRQGQWIYGIYVTFKHTKHPSFVFSRRYHSSSGFYPIATASSHSLRTCAPMPNLCTACNSFTISLHQTDFSYSCGRTPGLTHDWYWSPEHSGRKRFDSMLMDIFDGMQAAQRCNFAHTHGYYGENLFASTAGPANWSAAISAWASEAPAYRPSSPYLSGADGHFTQLVWKDTKWIGCAWQQCDSISNLAWPDGGWIYYCKSSHLNASPWLNDHSLVNAICVYVNCEILPANQALKTSRMDANDLPKAWMLHPIAQSRHV